MEAILEAILEPILEAMEVKMKVSASRGQTVCFIKKCYL